MNTKRREQRPLGGIASGDFLPDSERHSVTRTMDDKRGDKGHRYIAKMERSVGIEMTRRACRTNMMNRFADDKEQGITSRRRDGYHPGGRDSEGFRSKSKQCHT